MVPSQEIALELAQETFFRAWQHFAELQVYDRPEAWLYRVATNLAISHLRRKKSLCFAQLFRHGGSEADQADATVEYEFLADPFDMEQQTADRVLIEQTLQQLAERQRAALLLRAVYGLSCQEISETPEIVVLAVKPQTMDAVLPDLRRFADAGSVFLSIAAGKTLKYFASHLGTTAKVVRSMPNTPAAVRQGITVACASQGVSAA